MTNSGCLFLMKKGATILSLIFGFTLAASAEVHTYTIDPVHSRVEFEVRNFFKMVPGGFSSFEGEIIYDAKDPSSNRATARIDVPSVDTRNQERDDHLQNEDFFKADEYPLIEFSSTEWISTGENRYTVKGLLIMAGVEKLVELDVTFLGETEAQGTTTATWTGTTTINRTDWGISYGKPVIGKKVDIELNIQAVRG